jgi:class 3 adenylate cyclase
MIIPFDRTPRRDVARMRELREQQSSFVSEGLLAIMVSDLVNFTARVDELGDFAGRAWIREHNRILRSALQAHSGHEVAHTGDGMITAFRSVSAALRCAKTLAMQLSAAETELPMQARIGVHAGEPLPEDGRLFGTAINMAVRVCAQAGAGQVLVTDVVRQLARGAGFTFRARGLTPLKGLASAPCLYELEQLTAP